MQQRQQIEHPVIIGHPFGTRVPAVEIVNERQRAIGIGSGGVINRLDLEVAVEQLPESGWIRLGDLLPAVARLEEEVAGSPVQERAPGGAGRQRRAALAT